MANTIETTDEKTSKIRWDLSVLYSDIADPRLDSDLAALTSMAKHFSASYKGKLAERLDGAIRDYLEIEMLSGKIASYSVPARDHGPDQCRDQGQARRLSARNERGARGAPHVL